MTKTITMAASSSNSSDEQQRNDSESEEEDISEQVRVTFVLDPSVSDRSLEVPSEPIAIPADLKRKGLSAAINHLLDRDYDSKDEEDSDDDQDNKALPFDFIIANKLLRTGVETAARRHGLSLEQAIKISYLPAQQAPEESNEGDPLPDWISTIDYREGMVCTGCYDGSIVVHKPTDGGLETVASVQAHSGPIKCLATMQAESDSVMIATGSLDQTLVTHYYDEKTRTLEKRANFLGGHTSSVGSVDLLSSQQQMASGDWDGNLSLWNLSSSLLNGGEEFGEPVKKRKTGTKSKSDAVVTVQPQVTFKAHASQISGVSWPHYSKSGNVLVTGSWDHSRKVWDVERQDVLLTLNGSRVISCIDTSYHSDVVATGHPDCTIRLWDVRVNTNNESSLVSDTTLKPSHKAWVSAVQWSKTDPYVLASTSHDRTLKLWDIRSSLPLHTVRAYPKEEKGLCLAFGDDSVIFTGGSDCFVKQYKC